MPTTSPTPSTPASAHDITDATETIAYTSTHVVTDAIDARALDVTVVTVAIIVAGSVSQGIRRLRRRSTPRLRR
jgi:hypothetical protein